MCGRHKQKVTLWGFCGVDVTIVWETAGVVVP